MKKKNMDSRIVKKLLTPKEIEMVSGGGTTQNGDFCQESGSYTQGCGNHTQGSGSYTQTCPFHSAASSFGGAN